MMGGEEVGRRGLSKGRGRKKGFRRGERRWEATNVSAVL